MLLAGGSLPSLEFDLAYRHVVSHLTLQEGKIAASPLLFFADLR
jgi:hypothetical protein